MISTARYRSKTHCASSSLFRAATASAISLSCQPNGGTMQKIFAFGHALRTAASQRVYSSAIGSILKFAVLHEVIVRAHRAEDIIRLGRQQPVGQAGSFFVVMIPRFRQRRNFDRLDHSLSAGAQLAVFAIERRADQRQPRRPGVVQHQIGIIRAGAFVGDAFGDRIAEADGPFRLDRTIQPASRRRPVRMPASRRCTVEACQRFGPKEAERK